MFGFSRSAMLGASMRMVASPKALLGAVIIIGLVVQSYIITTGFLYKYANGDTMIVAGAAKIYATLNFPEPFFFGQPYLFLFESILGVPLIWLGVRADVATIAVCIGLFYLPVLSLMMYIYRKNKLLFVFIGVSPIFISFDYSLVSQIPYGQMGSVGLGASACVVYLFDDRKSTLRKLCLCLLGACVAGYPPTSLLVPLIMLRDQGRQLMISMVYVGIGSLLIYSLKFFYVLHPSYIVHAAPNLSLNKMVFVENISNPEIRKVFLSSVPFLWIAIIVVIFRIRRYNSEMMYALLGYVLIVTLALATTKVRDGGESLFFSKQRFFIASPIFFIIYSSYIFKDSFIINHVRNLKLYKLVIIILMINLIQLTRLHQFIDNNIPKISETYSYPVVPLANRDYLKLSCDRIVSMMRGAPIGVIEGRNDLIAYGCTVLTSKQIIQTVYERRTWMKGAVESSGSMPFIIKQDFM